MGPEAHQVLDQALRSSVPFASNFYPQDKRPLGAAALELRVCGELAALHYLQGTLSTSTAPAVLGLHARGRRVGEPLLWHDLSFGADSFSCHAHPRPLKNFGAPGQKA